MAHRQSHIAATTAVITSSYIGGTHDKARLRERTNCVYNVGSLSQLTNLIISSLQVCSQVSHAHILGVAFHLAKLVKHSLGVGSSISSDSASVLRVLVAHRIDVAIGFAASLLSCGLFILHFLRFPRKFRLYLHPKIRGRALVSRLLVPILTR